MRRDMAQVVGEKPRRGGDSYRLTRRTERQRLRVAARDINVSTAEDFDPDVFDHKIGMRRSYRTRSKNWDLFKESQSRGPVVRKFLNSRVGRPWNDVYHEICAATDRRSPNGRQFIEVVEWEVQKSPRWFHYNSEPQWFRPFLVDEKGILRRNESSWRFKGQHSRYRPTEPPVTSVPLSDGQRLVMDGGIWYYEERVERKDPSVPPQVYYLWHDLRGCLRQTTYVPYRGKYVDLKKFDAHEHSFLCLPHGCPGSSGYHRTPVHKRYQLSTKELKQAGLHNDPPPFYKKSA